jgi:hypothetical protein
MVILAKILHSSDTRSFKYTYGLILLEAMKIYRGKTKSFNYINFYANRNVTISNA